MPKAGATGIKRIIDAAGYSMRGLRAALKHEAAFRQELALAVVLTPVALYAGQSNIERTILAGRAKDIGSAAVFISLANVVFVWGLILFT